MGRQSFRVVRTSAAPPEWRASFTPAIPGTGLLLRAFTRTVVTSVATHLAHVGAAPHQRDPGAPDQPT
jgi:hypothetical protein